MIFDAAEKYQSQESGNSNARRARFILKLLIILLIRLYLILNKKIKKFGSRIKVSMVDCQSTQHLRKTLLHSLSH